jgi:potassium-transporting ATPase potassium-binding subunit
VNAFIQSATYVLVLVALAIPLGAYMARVYSGDANVAQRVLGPVERLFYRLAGVKADQEMTWKQYAFATLLFNLFGLLVVYALQRLQDALPLNPAAFSAVSPELSMNTAISFASNTNWQGYGGETTLSYLTQLLGMTVQNFVSAATGMAVLVALVRGFTRSKSETVGSFWVDLTRSTLYILLPLSVVLTLLIASQGVVQTFAPSAQAVLTDPTTGADNAAVAQQSIAVGPAASQVAIKQLGTNGGGFFNVNSAHPLENPTPFSNFVQMISILLIAAALCFTFGKLVKDHRQGRALLAAMFAIFLPLLALTIWAESQGNPLFTALGVDASLGNMEGKESRFGVVSSAIWAVATTAASNGSVNSMHDSFMPLGGMVPMWLMQLGEIIFGGVGSGLYGMLIYAIIAVFIAGLMVGRTPEYLGKKVETREVKLAMLYVLVFPLVILAFAAWSSVVPYGLASLNNAGPHGLSEILYAFTSAAGNNGSAFAGLNANTPWFNTTLGIAMVLGRFAYVLPVMAMAGSLGMKTRSAASPGTFPTTSALFVGLLVGVILILGGLQFFPALALGPIVEQVLMHASATF